MIEVNANITHVLPSMFVLSTRRICWKFGGTTNDIFSEMIKDVISSYAVSFQVYRYTVVFFKSFNFSKMVMERGFKQIYSFSSVRSLAWPLVSLMANWAARSTINFLNKKYQLFFTKTKNSINFHKIKSFSTATFNRYISTYD